MSTVDPELLAEFRMLTEQAAEYRRKSYGRNHNLPRTGENRRAVPLLSRHLFLINRLVQMHPELREEYRGWCRLYPSFTSDY